MCALLIFAALGSVYGDRIEVISKLGEYLNNTANHDWH